MSVYGDVEELQNLEQEITRLNKMLKALRLDKKKAEERIYDFCEREGEVGFKHKNMAVTIGQRKVRGRKKLVEKKDQMYQILNDARDPTSSGVLEDILESMKGPYLNKKSVKIERIKDF